MTLLLDVALAVIVFVGAFYLATAAIGLAHEIKEDKKNDK